MTTSDLHEIIYSQQIVIMVMLFILGYLVATTEKL